MRDAEDSARARSLLRIRAQEATWQPSNRAGSSGGKHPKNKLFTGGVPPKKKRHPPARV
jgi:hypothetical protein